MNKFAVDLLKQSYNNYQKTGSLNFNFTMYNGDDFLFYTDACKYLAENKYINAISDNIFDNSINVFDNVLNFELLPKGIKYVETLK